MLSNGYFFEILKLTVKCACVSTLYKGNIIPLVLQYSTNLRNYLLMNEKNYAVNIILIFLNFIGCFLGKGSQSSFTIL